MGHLPPRLSLGMAHPTSMRSFSLPPRCAQKCQELRPVASVAVGAHLDAPWVPEGQAAPEDEGSAGAGGARLPSNGSSFGP